MFKKFKRITITFLIMSGCYMVAPQASTLQDVKDRGYLLCGVSSGLAGFSIPDETGVWQGLDVEYCRAIASAVFNDPKKVRFIALAPKEKYPSLISKQVDVLARNSTWTFSRDVDMPINFPAINYYDGQGFMVNSKKLPEVKSAKDLNGATICVQAGTTTELNLADYFSTNNMQYEPLVFDKFSEVNAAYDAGRCDAYTTDRSSLYGVRLQLSEPSDHTVLDDLVSREPLAVMVRDDDKEWETIVRWVHNVLLNAEEFGVTKANVEEMTKSNNPNVRRFLGVEKGAELGKNLNLSNQWIVQVIKGTGNYGEIFDRSLGEGSLLKIPRGLNAQWNAGGLMYAIPVR